jgi:methylthioribulose-1-phosphate dehydratase
MNNPMEAALRESLVATGRWVGGKGWCPATSGNLSARIDQGHYLISVSGRDKGSLGVGDFLAVDLTGSAVGDSRKPSAETLLHGVIYRLFREASQVIHTHSVFGMVMTRHAGEGEIVLDDYELLKAFPGVDTHDRACALPVFANDQDMTRLAAKVEARLQGGMQLPAFGLAGHGVYSWGRDASEARRHAEAVEILLECEYRARLLAHH